SPAPATTPGPAAGASDPAALASRIRELAREGGFQRCGITGIDLAEDEAHLADWLGRGLYGAMEWMARHGRMRARPAELLPGARSGWTTAAATPRRPGGPAATAGAPTSPDTRWAGTPTR